MKLYHGCTTKHGELQVAYPEYRPSVEMSHNHEQNGVLRLVYARSQYE
jgi:hypothetical protein